MTVRGKFVLMNVLQIDQPIRGTNSVKHAHLLPQSGTISRKFVSHAQQILHIGIVPLRLVSRNVQVIDLT
jgi:hypothetical protein